MTFIRFVYFSTALMLDNLKRVTGSKRRYYRQYHTFIVCGIYPAGSSRNLEKESLL